ncbi:MAG: hypothetical protein ACE5DX_00255 [Candidatus Dojkabacteria bacterium]
MVLRNVKGNLVLEGKDVKVLVATAKGKDAGGKVEPDIILSNRDDLQPTEGQSLIDSAGEYEIKDVFVYALSTNGDKLVDLFSIDLENIKIVYVDEQTRQIGKKVLDQVGIANIVVIDMENSSLEEKVNVIRVLDPEYLIPLGSQEVIKKLAKQLELEIPDTEKKFKIRSSELSEEDYGLKLVLLQ